MIDIEWIDSLKNGGMETQFTGSRQDVIDGFVACYRDFQPEDEW